MAIDSYTTRKKRTFLYVGDEPYTTKDGRAITISVWEAKCRFCRAPYTVTAPGRRETQTDAEYLAFLDKSASFGIVHCEKHRMKKKQAIAAWRAAGHDAQRKLSRDDVLEIRKLLSKGHRPKTLALVYPVSVSTIYQIKYHQSTYK